MQTVFFAILQKNTENLSDGPFAWDDFCNLICNNHETDFCNLTFCNRLALILFNSNFPAFLNKFVLDIPTIELGSKHLTVSRIWSLRFITEIPHYTTHCRLWQLVSCCKLIEVGNYSCTNTIQLLKGYKFIDTVKTWWNRLIKKLSIVLALYNWPMTDM